MPQGNKGAIKAQSNRTEVSLSNNSANCLPEQGLEC